MQTSADALRDHFLGWQCRIRQIAMRQDGGRPSAGMRPRLLTTAGRELSSALTVLLVPKEPEESTAFFRFQVQKSRDPREIYEKGLAFLQADFFQQPKEFSETLTAVLSEGPLAETLLNEGTCVLKFDQFRQRYRLPCAVATLSPGDAAREGSVWHNRIFNPVLPETARVIAFQPDWLKGEAQPEFRFPTV